ncbi:MAG: acyltransferase, partial [Alphaproteobacteria bacterium]
MASIWAQAKEMAAATPAARNRYVDFLRAFSILIVITGHWLIAAFYYDGAEITLADILALKPTIQWLTWIFQVMPIFFFVGGYANAVSLESSKSKNESYAAWLTGRLHRLVTPLLAVILVWGVLAFVFTQFGARVELVAIASQAALIPIWFLAIYIMVVILAPLTYRFWKAWGFKSLFVFVAIGALVDWLFFAMDMRIFNWSSYFWVWLSVHHFGYAWAEGRIGSPIKMLALSLLGLGALALLILAGPYPLAMVGSPDEISNTLPPKMTLVALGVFQFGLAMALQAPMRRFLDRLNVWAATVLINSMIMTVYLWHLTVMMVVVAVLYLLGGLGISILPDTALWWETRPLWILVLYVALIPTALL